MTSVSPVLWVMQNAQGMRVCISNYGATVVSLWVPDRSGEMGNVVLGFDSLESYQNDPDYMGRTIGRLANRVGDASFLLPEVAEGRPVQLEANHGGHQLHGGSKGFHTKIWELVEGESCFYQAIVDTEAQQAVLREKPFAQQVEGNEEDTQVVTLACHSSCGEEGYPATLEATVRYSLSPSGVFSVEFFAKPDAPTVVDMTHHSYFNLSGTGDDKGCLNQTLQLNSSEILVVDRSGVATGMRANVLNSELDFTSPVALEHRVDADHPAITQAKGIDHYFILDSISSGRAPRALCPLEGLAQRNNAPDATSTARPLLHKAAELIHPDSGRVLEVYTSAPGLQVYTANFVKAVPIGLHDIQYGPRTGVCLETHGYPNAPNMPHFPSVVVTPDAPYLQTTEFRFSTQPLLTNS